MHTRRLIAEEVPIECENAGMELPVAGTVSSKRAARVESKNVGRRQTEDCALALKVGGAKRARDGPGLTPQSPRGLNAVGVSVVIVFLMRREPSLVCPPRMSH